MMLAFLALLFVFPQSAEPVVVVARDFTFEAPARVAGPQVRILFRNAGLEPHYMRFLRMTERRTLDDFAAWRQAGGPLPTWLRGAGGIGTVGSGESAEFSARLEPGHYVIMCGHPSPDGVQHVDKGMYGLLTVEDAGSAQPPPHEGTITLAEHTVAVSREFAAGRQTFLVRNTGKRTHQALLVFLGDGVRVESELAWFRGGSKGARAGQPMGGIVELQPGAEAFATFNLRAGRYALFCSIPDRDQRHFDLGMLHTFEVR